MMIEFITNAANGPYFFALAFLVFFFIIEIFGYFVGLSISSICDNLFDFDVDFDADLGIGTYFGFLGLGKVPFIVWLTFFFGLFSVLGYLANSIAVSITGFLPLWVSIAPIFIAAIIINSYLCNVFASIFPRIETTAVSTDSFFGRVAEVTLGNATNNKFAMGVVLDEYQTAHNIRVKSMKKGVVLEQHSQVILVEQTKGSAIWLAIPYES